MQIEFPKQTTVSESFFLDKKKVFIGSVLMICLIALLSAKLGGGVKGKIGDFFALHSEAQLLAKGEADFDRLTRLINDHKEVAPFFDAAIIQNYFLLGDAEKAQEVGTRSLKRLNYRDENTVQFAKGSLLIEQGNHQDALQSARELQGKIEGRKEYASMAFFNLVRISLLEETIHGKAKESWDRVARYVSPENEMLDESLRNTLISHLSDGKSTFFDFLKSRR